MVGSRVINCSKCGRELFYLPDSYKMSCKVICVDCGNKTPKKKRVGKAVKRTAVANYAKIKKGIRKDIHPTYMFRSPTEANFARILDFHGAQWKFEERAFTFDGYKTKPYVYIMDFEVTSGPKRKKKELLEDLEPGFYEVKGYMNVQSRKKLRRLKMKYPNDAQKTTVIIYSKYNKKDIELCEKHGYRYMFYDVLTKHYEPLIPTWE
jgi:hypothetical protein